MSENTPAKKTTAKRAPRKTAAKKAAAVPQVQTPEDTAPEVQTPEDDASTVQTPEAENPNVATPEDSAPPVQTRRSRMKMPDLTVTLKAGDIAEHDLYLVDGRLTDKPKPGQSAIRVAIKGARIDGNSVALSKSAR